jgi:large subunit ribosomal protein L6
MHTIEIPSGVDVKVNDDQITIKGKLGSTSKRMNTRLMEVKVESGKINIKETENKKLIKKAVLAEQAFESELRSAMKGVQEGIERKMVVFFAHFPMVIEVKGKVVSIKNIFGERTPRTTEIVGDTKVDVKGQDVTIKGVDAYDVGQTVANIRKACYSIGDTRVFQDGVYLAKSE